MFAEQYNAAISLAECPAPVMLRRTTAKDAQRLERFFRQFEEVSFCEWQDAKCLRGVLIQKTTTAYLAFDVAAVRTQFPSLASGVAYFDGPGGTQTPSVVAGAIVVKETATAGPKLGGAIGNAADSHAGSASEQATPPPASSPVQQPPAVLPPPTPKAPPAPTGKG